MLASALEVTARSTVAATAGGGASVTECVGANNALNTCGPWSPSALVIAIPNTTQTFTLNAVLDGQVKNTGSTKVTLSGITNSDYSCEVNISGNCTKDSGNAYGSSAGNLSGTGTYTLTSTNPTTTNATKCNGSYQYIVSHVTVNVACTYGTL